MMARARPERDSTPKGQHRGLWLHGRIPVVGITGTIGAGKSTASKIIESQGAFLLDVDEVGHSLLDQTPQRVAVVERFGPSVIKADPTGEAPTTIDRNVLGSIVFANEPALRDLEAILHPAMRRTCEKAIARENRRTRSRAVLLDAAILFEAGWDDICDVTIFVDASLETRLARLETQRGWSAEKLAAREKMQWPAAKKRESTTYQINNDGSPEALHTQVIDIWKAILNSRRERYRVLRTSPRDE